jgi:DNA invertase Pin-like site-specific DNA recombinase
MAKSGAKLVAKSNAAQLGAVLSIAPLPTSHTTRVGYARVSTFDQSLVMQEDALKSVGCTKIFTDQASGAAYDRPGLADLLKFLREGDTLVVWKLDRLGRSLPHLIETVQELRDRGIAIRSIKENIDSATATGRMFLNMIAVLAEFERELISERTQAGLAAARARGRLGGRKPVLTKAQVNQAITLINDGHKFMEVCATLGCSPRTLRRRVAEANG